MHTMDSALWEYGKKVGRGSEIRPWIRKERENQLGEGDSIPCNNHTENKIYKVMYLLGYTNFHMSCSSKMPSIKNENKKDEIMKYAVKMEMVNETMG